MNKWYEIEEDICNEGIGGFGFRDSGRETKGSKIENSPLANPEHKLKNDTQKSSEKKKSPIENSPLLKCKAKESWWEQSNEAVNHKPKSSPDYTSDELDDGGYTEEFKKVFDIINKYLSDAVKPGNIRKLQHEIDKIEPSCKASSIFKSPYSSLWGMGDHSGHGDISIQIFTIPTKYQKVSNYMRQKHLEKLVNCIESRTKFVCNHVSGSDVESDYDDLILDIVL